MEQTQNYAKCPWRRYFARELDLSIYMVIWNALMTIPFSMGVPRISNPFVNQLVTLIVSIGLILLIEPVLLHQFGTTPGKKIFGLRITKEDGSFLSIREARARAFKVLMAGTGFLIPIYSLFRLFKSYRECVNDAPMSWDRGYVYTAKKANPFMWSFFIISWFGMFCLNMMIALFSQVAPNRGRMSVAEFAQNYNYVAQVYDMQEIGLLNPDGTWQEGEQEALYMGITKRPEFQFTESGGIVTGVSFVIEGSSDEEMVSTGNTWMSIAALAYTNGQTGMGAFSDTRDAMLDQMTGYDDFDFTIGDVQLTCERELVGYTLIESTDYLVPDKNAKEHYYKTDFEMKLH